MGLTRVWSLLLTQAILLTFGAQATNLEYQILEELPVGTNFANVITGGNLAKRYGEENIERLEFSFLSGAESDNKQSYFGIEEKTGLLFMAKVLDREEVCPFLEVCDISLDVAVGPAEFFHVISISIEVMDKNDNSPVFSQEALHLYIPEITPQGTAYPIQAASDSDVGIYGIQTYTLVPELQYFGIETSVSIDGSAEVRIVVKHKLDREAVTSFQFDLIAADGGRPANTATMLINITIGDDNDNVPVFTKAEYQVALQEDTAVPTVIIDVQANDPDTGAGGIVSYAFTAKTFQMYGHIFGINENTGEIKLTRALDYEETDEFQLTVSAKDGAPNAKASFAKVTVRVLDVNDYEPLITINTLTASENAAVSEESRIGTFVAHISVIDRDSGMNGQVTCQLQDSNKFSLTFLQDTQYKVVTSATLDHEEESQYEVTIECSDAGEEPLKTSKQLSIVVLDYNDNSPVFDLDVYSAVLAENNPQDAYITKVNASDVDRGDNGEVSYELLDVTTMFYIDQHTGVIRAKDVLDYEHFHEVEFSVLAVDNGIPQKTATAQVVVSLLDVNDEMPKFTLKTYTFVVMENMDAGSHVGHVSATDADSEPYNYIEYDFHVGDIGMGEIFDVDRQTGSIYTKIKLDREVLSTYTFRVIASNKGFSQMSSTSTVHVYVDDQNDNLPHIHFPNATDFTVRLFGLSGVGEIVTQVKATDADVGTSGKLSFTLSPNNSPFDIDTNTGIIILTEDTEDLTDTVYNLTINVKDHGIPPRMQSAFIMIIVNTTIAPPFSGMMDGMLVSAPNMIIVIIVVAVSGILMILLLMAIAWVVYRNRKHADDPATHEKYPYVTTSCSNGEAIKQTVDADLSTSSISGGFDDGFKRNDQRHSNKDFNRKNSFPRGQHSSDSGFSDVFTVTGTGKHVSFALTPQTVTTDQPPRTQEIDGDSTSSNEGSNTDSGCILPDDGRQQQHQQQQHHHQKPSPPPLLPPRLRDSPPPLLPPRDDSPPSPLPPILYPRHLTVRDIKAKDKLKRGLGFGVAPTTQQNTASDFAYNIPDVIQNNFSDSNSLMRYKANPSRKDRFSQSDNTSTTSGSYVIDGNEAAVTEYNV